MAVCVRAVVALPVRAHTGSTQRSFSLPASWTVRPTIALLAPEVAERRRWAAGSAPRAAVAPTSQRLGSLRRGDVKTGASEKEGLVGTVSDGLDPALEQAVPRDQRPSNELKSIKEASLYKWAVLDSSGYAIRIGSLFAATFALISGPISYQTFDPLQQPLEFFLSSSTGACFVVSVAAIRMYLGWSYIGNRLLSASIAYEETGWYDGQIFVKPQEVLARDRLLGTYEVKPVLAKLKATLIGSAGALALSAVLLFVLIGRDSDADGVYGRGASVPVPRSVTTEGIIYSSRVSTLDQLRYDDEAAAAEAAAAGDRPAYCGDRYFKSVAGGEQVCAKFDVK